jgi:hypothetical protein
MASDPAALKAPQDASPGQRPGSRTSSKSARPEGARGPSALSGRIVTLELAVPGRCPGLVSFAQLARELRRSANREILPIGGDTELTIEESALNKIVAIKKQLARAGKALAYAQLGAFVFWTPNVLVHWIIAYNFSGFVVLGLTVLLPATTLLFFRAFLWPSVKQDSRLSPALFAVLGIWIAGPAMLTFSSSFCGGGLTQPDAWRFFVFGTLLFPLFTLVMSAYDGNFFALLLTTLLLPILANSRFKKPVHRYL